MDPNDPWAIPPPPEVGDADNTMTFIAVGEALSSWEWLEGNLGLLFGEFVAPGQPALAAQRAYGAIATYRGRADMLRHAAAAYFAVRPSLQTVQADFEAQMKIIDRAAPRRNDIARGIVQPFDFGPLARSFALYPSYYTSTRRKIDGSPAYEMTSVEIKRFGQQFRDLQPPILALLDRLHERHVGRT